MNRRPTIGLCIIAKNEEENLPKLFKSFEGCFDEVYLTDTGSIDATAKVAAALGAKVSNFTWIDDFAAARNFCFDQAKTDYICWIDCDDVLSSKEEFITWRDTTLGLADMWLATYNYAYSPDGRPVCRFARERVIKNGIGIKWKYFVHEGLLPTGNRRISANYVTTWSINHQRTESDLIKDRSRNLWLIEKNKDKLDSRMKFYYGKELFENNRHFDSIKWLTEASSDPTLEPHDRILSIQYAGYAYMKCDQFNKAIDIALVGLQLAPQRAEFLTIIGDSYIKLNRVNDAAPYYRAALECTPFGNGQQSAAIFSTEEQYNVYPLNQLARIYANTGRLDKAIDVSYKSHNDFGNIEAKGIMEECIRIKTLTEGYKDAVACSDIVITCPPNAPYKWDGEIYKTRAMGGSETAAIEVAQWIKKLSGRKVKIFNVRDDEKTIDGVEYIPTGKLNEYMAKNKPYLHIAWRHNFKITNAPTFLWSHDLTTPGVENTENYVKVMALTPFHKAYLHTSQGVPMDKIWVTRNGIEPSRFADGPWEKDPWKFVFSSSPDRGLDRAMRVLDKVREKYPQIKLHVFYGIEHLDNYGLKDLRERLAKMMDERKDWVVYHGKTEQLELMKHFKSAAYNVQPSDWIETSCITAMELVLAGVYPIFRAVGGVCDTLKPAEEMGMASLVSSDCITELDHQKYVDETIKVIEEERYKRVKMDATGYSWESVVRSWLEELPKMAYGNTV